MEHGQELHSHNDAQYATIYPPDLHSYATSPSSFMIQPGSTRQRFHHSDAFGSPHRHDQHEAEHVFNSPQLTLDPSTLNLRSNSNDNPSPSANTTGSNSSTPTGSLRLSTFNLHNNLSANGVTTRRRARAQLEQLQIQIQVGVHPQPEVQSQHPHQQSDIQDVQMQPGDLHIHVDDHNDSGITSQTSSEMTHEQEQGQGGETPHPRNMYALLPSTDSPQGFYLGSNPEAFTHSPASPSTPSDGSRDPNLQGTSSTPGFTPPSSSSTSLARAFRPGLSLGIPGNRSMPLIASPGQQQFSPSHNHHPQLSSHPHMHPSPYYQPHQNTGSPGYPSTPTTSHHTQGSSSSSHSSGHTRYSLHGSPGPRGFGRTHARSSSFGTTVSNMSARSNSPANSVASAFTSLSGGHGGSGTGSTSGLAGSPTSYGERADVQMPFVGQSPPQEGAIPLVSHHARSQSHPPLSMPTAQHPAPAAFSALLPPPRKNISQQGPNGYLMATGERFTEEPHEGTMWQPHLEEMPSPPMGLGPRMTEEEFQAQFRPKPIITRAPHRKQKLANSDRKAICMYAKQHPSARQEDIAARYNVERSTISKILKNKERWLGCPDDETKVARKRKPRFDDLELVLKVWVENTRDQGLVLSDALIRSQAKEQARQLGISEDKFKASSGWLENFKHRVGIRKGKYVGREPWLAVSDSEGEEPPPSAKQPGDERGLFFAEPSAGYGAVKGFWRVPVPPEVQRQEGTQQNGEQIMQASSSEHASGSTSEHPESRHLASGQLVESQSDSQTSEPRSLSRAEGRQPMRKTRSRTLAEAREASTTLAGAPGSPTAPAPQVTTLAPAPALAMGPTLASTLAATSSAPPPIPGHEPLSHSASRSPSAVTPDGRDASAGLNAALDFIGCQPEGFASPEEVAVLRGLQRRMSRAELPCHRLTPSGWNGAREG